MKNTKDNTITIQVLRIRSFAAGILFPTIKTVLAGLIPVIALYFIFYSTGYLYSLIHYKLITGKCNRLFITIRSGRPSISGCDFGALVLN